MAIYIRHYVLIAQLFVVYGHLDQKPGFENRKFVKDGNITIAGLFPIHVRGCEQENFRPAYLALSQAMVYAIEKVNNDTRLLPNVSLGFEIYDYCLIDRQAMETALEITNRRKMALLYDKYSNSEVCFSRTSGLGQVPVMIGTGTSGNSILVANLLQVEDIPLISYAATSDELSKMSYPTFLRTVPPDRFSSQAMADIAEYFNWTFIAAIAANNAYGRSGIDYFKKQIGNKGTCLAMERYFLDGTSESGLEISRIIAELKDLDKVEVVVLYCTKKQARLLLDEAREQNISKKTWIASEGWGDSNEVLKPDILPVVKGLLGVVYSNVQVDGFVEYLTSLTSAYRPVHWKNFWESQFGCLFHPRALNNSKVCNDSLRITKSMYTASMHTSMSAYVINAVYAIAHALHAMTKCSVPHCLSSKGTNTVNPKDLLTYLKAVNFTSPVSHVSFDVNGDPNGSYNIINLQKRNGRWEFRSIGSWDSQVWPHLNIDDDIIMWNGDTKGRPPKSVCEDVCSPGYWQTPRVGCCWQCIECPLDEISVTYGARNCSKCPHDYISNTKHVKCIKVPVVHITYDDAFGLIFMTISSLGLLGTAYITAVFVRHNKSPIVKASNRELSYMLLFCIAMCYVAPFIYLAKPSHYGCILVQVWFYLFYTTCVAILGAKTNKIVLLFEQRVPRSRYTSKFFIYRHVLIVATAMLLELIVIIIWVFVDPPQPHVNRASREKYVYTCKPSRHITGKVCQYSLMSILIIMSVICCFFAYKARRLPDNFNEGKFIAFSMYILSISWLTFYPVFLNIQDDYSVVVLSITTFVSASGLLVCMFWPKVYIIIWYPHKNTRHHMQEQLSQHAFQHDEAKDRQRSDNQSSLHRSRSTSNVLDRLRLVLPTIHGTGQNTTQGSPHSTEEETPRDAVDSSGAVKGFDLNIQNQGIPRSSANTKL